MLPSFSHSNWQCTNTHSGRVADTSWLTRQFNYNYDYDKNSGPTFTLTPFLSCPLHSRYRYRYSAFVFRVNPTKNYGAVSTDSIGRKLRYVTVTSLPLPASSYRPAACRQWLLAHFIREVAICYPSTSKCPFMGGSDVQIYLSLGLI